MITNLSCHLLYLGSQFSWTRLLDRTMLVSMSSQFSSMAQVPKDYDEEPACHAFAEGRATSEHRLKACSPYCLEPTTSNITHDTFRSVSNANSYNANHIQHSIDTTLSIQQTATTPTASRTAVMPFICLINDRARMYAF